MNRGVALFAQYHPRGAVLPHVRYALGALSDAGLIVHVAVAGRLDELDDDSIRPLRARGVVFHARPNAGLDFGSWQHLIRAGCADGADRVLLVNDSVLGPFQDLAPILRDMHAAPAWGMVASRQIRPHLQSWFVCLDGDLFRSPSVQRVFAQDFATMSRDEIIVHGEVGLSLAIEAAGAAWTARWPHVGRRLALLARLLPSNPAHSGWLRMLGNVPYMKVELLRDDPGRVAPPGRWRAALGRMGYPASWADEAIAASPPRPRHALNWRGRLVQRLARH